MNHISLSMRLTYIITLKPLDSYLFSSNFSVDELLIQYLRLASHVTLLSYDTPRCMCLHPSLCFFSIPVLSLHAISTNSVFSPLTTNYLLLLFHITFSCFFHAVTGALCLSLPSRFSLPLEAHPSDTGKYMSTNSPTLTHTQGN